MATIDLPQFQTLEDAGIELFNEGVITGLLLVRDNVDDPTWAAIKTSVGTDVSSATWAQIDAIYADVNRSQCYPPEHPAGGGVCVILP